MEEIRCGACRRKLGEGIFTALTIKCPRCGGMNHLRAMSPPPARQGASTDGIHHDDTHHSLDRRQTPTRRPVAEQVPAP
ncbi:hypothetical protein C380_18315 [Acidovorax sp. KKS102]|uniref:Com family DNA-binding transcriptional regulator n=1 Tax=Acidovorax sp. KKS102 TaxID=358220 RepID=UPI00028A58DA|nr:Com family DNA-binding transcriptional regulator [Acidovorax sp. KKS102]AFU47357.1 hypothetical protein C380_18315 [Acidovorax sp. KKS102]